jgi:tetratricopeptide (TPR) repeat protein
LIFATLALAGPQMREIIPYGFAPLILLVSGTPHYGATLLRVYEKREDLQRYRIFALWATAVIGAWFLAALRWEVLGSLLLTLMLTWSPWHYTGQNYGIALMFLRRRGVPVPTSTKRALYVSFLLSFVLTVLAVHGQLPGGEYAPTSYGGTSIRFLRLGIPEAVRAPAMLCVGTLYLGCLLLVGWQVRKAGWRNLMPAAVLVFTQALWFAVPALARQYGLAQGLEPLGIDYAAYAFLWVAVGHSVQYLWICSYYARREGRESRHTAYLLKALLAGAVLWTVPGLLLHPDGFGTLPYPGGLEVLISAAVNVHHFVLDGAIWKLRDGRVARILLRTEGQQSRASPRMRTWSPATLVWAAGALSISVIVASTLEAQLGFERALERGDGMRAAVAVERMRWLGRDGPSERARLSLLRAVEGEPDLARLEAKRSLELQETVRGWNALGRAEHELGNIAGAIASYEAALERSPDDLVAANNLAWILATEAEGSDPERAIELATRWAPPTPPPGATTLPPCSHDGGWSSQRRRGTCPSRLTSETGSQCTPGENPSARPRKTVPSPRIRSAIRGRSATARVRGAGSSPPCLPREARARRVARARAPGQPRSTRGAAPPTATAGAHHRRAARRQPLSPHRPAAPDPRPREA